MSEPHRLPRIGSQLFINRGDEPERIAAWVDQMADAGLELIRLFAFWDLVEPRPGHWDFRQFDAVFEAAARRGLGVVPTLMAETCPGWMRCTNNNQEQGPIDDLAHWQRALGYVSRMVERYRQHPALDSWIAWNEASRAAPAIDATLPLLRAFLKERYGGDIAALNRAWHPRFDGFEQIRWDHLRPQQGGPVPSFAAQMDAFRFNVHYLHRKLADIVARIRAADDHPVHLNPHDLAGNVFHQGQSVWRSGELFDFLGCSAHPVWHATRFGQARYAEGIAFFTALVRDAARHRRCWVSELQGGAALMSGGQTHCPTRREIRRWLWTGIGMGAEAVVYWCFNVRDDGGEAQEWGLLDWRGSPSVRLRETTRVVADLRRHRELFAGARPGRARVRILVSEASQMHAALGKGGHDPRDPRTPLAAVDAVAGACAVCRALGIPYQLVDERRLRDGGLDGAGLLVLPGSWVLEPGTAAAIAAFAAAGGALLADGLPGWKDPAGRVAPEERALLEQSLGAAIDDVECAGDGILLHPAQPGREPLPGFHTRVLLDPAADSAVLARDEDGRPVAVQRAAGAHGGRATWFGTNACQRYFAHREEIWLAAFAAAIGPELREDLAPRHPGHQVVVHRLERPAGPLWLVQNLGDEAAVELEAASPMRSCLVSGERWHDHPAGVIGLALPADEVLLVVGA